MAIIGFIFGSVIGMIVAALAWLGFGVALSTAFGLYVGIGIAGGLLCVLPAAIRPTPPSATAMQPVHA